MSENFKYLWLDLGEGFSISKYSILSLRFLKATLAAAISLVLGISALVFSKPFG